MSENDGAEVGCRAPASDVEERVCCDHHQSTAAHAHARARRVCCLPLRGHRIPIHARYAQTLPDAVEVKSGCGWGLSGEGLGGFLG
eukprot:2126257-Rhodomonas_salina.1